MILCIIRANFYTSKLLPNIWNFKMTKIREPLTPILDSQSVEIIKEKINSHFEPQYINVFPIKNAPLQECFDTVDTYITEHGGTRVLGWTLWELPGLFIEAEFHAVWESPTGDMKDLTPRPSPTNRILFIRDPSMNYNGGRVNNIRINYSENHIINDLFKIFEDEFEAFGTKGIVLQHQQMMNYSFEMRKASVHERMELIFKNLKKTDPCFCNSGEMLKNCHKKF